MYDKHQISESLKAIGWLTTGEIKQHPLLPSLNTILRTFKTNSIHAVWHEIGVEAPPSVTTKKAVIQHLKKTGWMKISDIKKDPNLPSTATIFRLFKTTSINDIWKELGIEVPPGFTKDSVSQKLKETGCLKIKQINEHPELPSHTKILQLFGATSVKKVWEELNLVKANEIGRGF